MAMGAERTVLTLPVNESFELEKAVCSHGFFMMAPNLWFSSSQTLQRPLRLTDRSSVPVRITQLSLSSQKSLQILVLGASKLYQHDQQYLLAQVARMLRISEEDDLKVNKFHEMYPVAKETGFGRVFRSPTLFEDMVKSILLCNCQWTRTLSMARALCELQLELNGNSLRQSNKDTDFSKSVNLSPVTPMQLEHKKRRKNPNQNIIMNLMTKFSENETHLAADESLRPIDLAKDFSKNSPTMFSSEEGRNGKLNYDQVSEEKLGDGAILDNQLLENKTLSFFLEAGNFPCPEELANLDEKILEKRCKVGFRSKRIVKLAQSIVEGALDLGKIEVLSQQDPIHLDGLMRQLLSIYGVGPYVCNNVLMSMGIYQRIPADTETLRHLKQFHARKQCTIGTIQKDIEEIYGKHEPFQFLVYWSEMWEFYEKRFGKLSQMPPSDYELITAHNMKNNIPKRKRYK
ncbi:uncharacterized protein LOC18442764 isoform X1 [Amborella trichopoda]|uniref:DNA-(apurinic or apyrimidinic site) lyase n=1 Tax=Amborella trichopoda TaxID=13333 RepID=U5CX36_AMBTC|nr:uncharacterized protein LOC18442764 isoform X1 [Amborella trichopoda]ERN14505.1 hypothetical protein AMTR_s00038p00020700 [Amborella trichopoda]|eukprot:XP_006853038.1 uncharacterized protein LOC18442764 isoform X1 [Amborella trichopoda]